VFLESANIIINFQTTRKMNWFNRKKKEQVEERSSTFDYLMYNGIGAYSTNKALLLSTVYRCVEVISDSVA